MAESIGEIMVEVDRIPDNSRSCSSGTSKGLKILTFHEAVTEAVRRGPKASVGGKALWKLTKSDNFNDFPEGSCGLLAPTSQDADDEDVADHIGELKTIKFGKSPMFQCLVLGIIVGALAITLLVPGLKRKSLWDLPLWKWDILLLALMSGRLISGCLVRVTLIFAERQFHLQKRLLYFAYGSKRAFQNFLWLGLVLLVWHSIFHSKLDSDGSRILPYVTKILLCLQVAALVWLLKTLLVKALASSFHVNTYFERIHEALFHQYVIETLSSKPLVESSHRTGDKEAGNSLTEALLPKAGNPRKKANDSATSFEKKEEIQKNSISAWYMKRMVHMIQHGSLLTLDEQILESDMEDASHVHISSKSEAHARKLAKKILLNVVKPESRLIYLDDLMRFMSKDDAAKTIRLFGAKAESEGIEKQALEDWVIEAFKERTVLARSLNDTNTAVDDLHNMVNVIVGIVTGIVWLIILGVDITQFLVFISSQLLLLAFVFGNSCKTVFESIIFLFVMHPYDVGDRIKVDGVQLIVEEMNILTTVFVKGDNLKIRYPNSVLATKPISNYNRSGHMAEEIVFCLHISTPAEKIHKMKQDIKEYIESKTEHWYPSPTFYIYDVQEMNKVVLGLWVTHRMNHQEMGERWARRTLLVEKMVEIFRQHQIEYHSLPLNVNVRSPSGPSCDRTPSDWMTSA